MSAIVTPTFTEIADSVLGVEAPPLKPEVAQWVLTLKFTDEQKARMLRLAELNNRGELTEAEREEMHDYLRIGSLLNLSHAKARLSLKQLGQSN